MIIFVSMSEFGSCYLKCAFSLTSLGLSYWFNVQGTCFLTVYTVTGDYGEAFGSQTQKADVSGMKAQPMWAQERGVPLPVVEPPPGRNRDPMSEPSHVPPWCPRTRLSRGHNYA